MKTAFVATVGKGDLGDIRKPLIKSISESNPSFILLFATPDTEGNARDICRDLSRTDSDSQVHILVQPREDVELLFKEMLDAITAMMRNVGASPSDVLADFTTGTKPMSAALVLAAVKLGLGRLKYMMVRRDDADRVCIGTERALTFEPVGLRASIMLDSALALMRQYRFDAVRVLVSDMPDAILNTTEKATRDGLLRLAAAYSDWDTFQHIRFRGAYERVDFSTAMALKQFQVSGETLSAVHDLGEQSGKGKLSPLAVVDLLNNARRRAEEGKYDDATARLYRACEMLAQWLLSEKGINSSDVDLSKVPKASVDWLTHCLGKSSKVEIGLHKSYQLLAEMGIPVGTRFGSDATLQILLKERNLSILAHGARPVQESSCRGLLGRVEAYAKEVIPDYDARSALFRFPWSG